MTDAENFLSNKFNIFLDLALFSVLAVVLFWIIAKTVKLISGKNILFKNWIIVCVIFGAIFNRLLLAMLR